MLIHPDASCVSLSGDFNGWSVSQTRLERLAGETWQIVMELPPGRYQYKFIVDGKWIPDPLAVENVWNEFGTLNSVVTVLC